MQILVDRSRSAKIPIRITEKSVEAIIDTGATRCCISLRAFRRYFDQPIETSHGINIRTADGTPINIKGRSKCSFKLGDKMFKYNFLVCETLPSEIIIGLDFLRQNRIGTTWTEVGDFALQIPDSERVCSLEVYFPPKTPKLYSSHHVTIPPRSMVSVLFSAQMRYEDFGKTYEAHPTDKFKELYPDLYMVPTIHLANSEKIDKIPVTLINVTMDDKTVHAGEMLVKLKERNLEKGSKDTEISEKGKAQLIQQLTEGPLVLIDKDLNKKNTVEETPLIISPAQVEQTRKTDLQDYPIKLKHKEMFRKLCLDYEDIFSKSSEDIGHTPLITMDIDTGDHPPICQKPYSLALKHVDYVNKELEILERSGVITKSMSPWASPIVIVPKKSAPGEPPKRRMCIDYRMLNSCLQPVKKAHSNAKGVLSLVPLPKIDEIYARLKGSVIYSALDCRSGYFHIGLTEQSKPKTAFVVGGPNGTKYEHNRVPFGLTQAPAYFQALIHKVLEGLRHCAFGYLDDILIFSTSIEEHIEHLKAVFGKLRQAKLKLKASKCSFFKQHIQYLGHLISGKGVEPVPEKLDSLKEMTPPKTPKEVRKFLGFVGYYRKFIPRFADIARPLTNLTKIDTPWEWTGKCQKTFELLKEKLLEEPILKYPDPSKPYTLFTDASKYAWACVLTQEYEHIIEGKTRKVLHPITYASGLFKGSQINWAALTKEAYAIYMSVKKLNYYLNDCEGITLRSDHLPLKKFLQKNTLNTNVNNWAVELSSYKINFEYIKGIKNTLADTMSRLVNITPEIQKESELPGYEFGYCIFEPLEPIKTVPKLINEIKEDTTSNKNPDPIPVPDEPKLQLDQTELRKLQSEDPFVKRIIKELMNGRLVSSPYYINNGLLHKKVNDNKQVFETLVVTPSCAPLLLFLAHNEMGHNGSTRTYMQIRRNYYWKGMKADIHKYVKQCKECKEYNITPVKYVTGQFSSPAMPMEFISMDLIGEFPETSNGNKYALTVICMLTGYTWCIPVKSKHAAQIIQAYLRQIYNKFGGSRKILSDNGTEFKNQYFEYIAKAIGVERKVYTAPFHPQSNGRIEGFHKFLKACMGKHISQNVEWDEVTSYATAAYNFFPNEHSRESPFFLMFGRDPIMPLTELLTPRTRYMGTDDNILSLECMKRIYMVITENLRIARQRMKPDKINNPTKLQTEDMIMIKNHAKGQFEPTYKGFYRIIAFKGNQLEVRHIKGSKTQFVHISDAKYVLPTDAILSQLPKYKNFNRLSTLNLNPKVVPDLNWKLISKLNTKSKYIPIHIQPNEKEIIHL